MIICRNAEGVHGQRKVGNPWARPWNNSSRRMSISFALRSVVGLL